MRLIATFTLLVVSTPVAATEEIDRIFAEWNSTHTPGCSVAVDRDGEDLVRKAYGMANLDYAVPANTDTRYHVASVSKQFTAAAALVLAREGKVSLDNHPREYLPEVKDLPDGISVRQLIHHTSGIRDQWDLLGLAGWRYALDRITNTDVITMLARQRDLNFEPNTEHLYSNSGYTLLAEIVERVSGQSFREFTTEHLFEPTGMADTFFRDDFAEVIPNRAEGYVKQKDGGYRLSVTNFDTTGATSLLATPNDLVKWANLFIDNHPLVDGMTQKGVLADGEEISYAFGVDVSEKDGKTVIGHGGSDAGYRAFLMTIPDDRISIALACNTLTNTGDLANQVYAAVTGTAKPKTHASPEPIPYRDAFDGDFYDPETGLMWRFRQGLATFMSFQSKLIATGKRKIAMPTIGVSGVFNRDFSEVKVTSPGQEATYLRVADTKEDLSGFAGTYYAPELDAVYRISSEDGKLALSYVKNPGIGLVRVDANTLSGEIGALRFSFDEDGRPDGFKLNTFRIRELAFRRIEI